MEITRRSWLQRIPGITIQRKHRLPLWLRLAYEFGWILVLAYLSVELVVWIYRGMPK